MKFTRSALLAATLAAAGAFAPALASEHAPDAWPAEAGAWRFAPPPAAAARPPEELPAVDAIVDFVVRATDPSNYRGAGVAGVAERGGGRYVFDLWLRGERQHSLVLVLPTSPEELPHAWLVTRRVQQRIDVADLMRMVDRTLDWSQRDSHDRGTGVTWRPLPPAPPPGTAPRATGKETTSSGAAFQPSFAGGVRVAAADVSGDRRIPDGALAGGAHEQAKYVNGFVSRFAAGGRTNAPPDPTRVDVKFPSLPSGGDSTTWVRVSQPHTTASVVLPRVGWEVLVHAGPGMPPGAVASGKPGSSGAAGLTARR